MLSIYHPIYRLLVFTLVRVLVLVRVTTLQLMSNSEGAGDPVAFHFPVGTLERPIAEMA